MVGVKSCYIIKCKLQSICVPVQPLLFSCMHAYIHIHTCTNNKCGMHTQPHSESCDDATVMDSPEDSNFSYSVKILNPSRMSDYTVRKWRMTTRFTSISDLVSKLQSSFEELKEKGDLSVGYIAPGHGAKGKKHWLNITDDLDDMYEAHKAGKSEILCGVTLSVLRKGQSL